MQRVDILGVPIDPVTQDEAVMRISQMLNDGGKHHVMTPNNEMLVLAQKNSTFKSLLQSSELNLPDSTGLLWAAARTGQHLPERVTGVDTVKRILFSCSSETPVFFLGGRKGVGRRALGKMQKENPNLVGDSFEGSPSKEDEAKIIKRINDSGAHLLLVAYGAPAQDMWINQHLLNLTSVKVAIGIGGTFDFLSGSIKRAPKWMQRSGIEWMWRLMIQPSRIGRIYVAVIRFPLLVLRG
jgi:N-acetylglucosaminyldiphosphoundecaprenol N-acetyl-beta-D-mannosaminyltransferase